MATIYNSGGGIPCFSSDCTAVDTQILYGKTAIFSTTNDEVGTGALPLKDVRVENGGTLCINSVLAF